MPTLAIFALYLAALLTFVAALLHFACLYWGAAGFRFLGAGNTLVKQAEKGHWYPKAMAIGVGLILTVFSLYAFTAARGVVLLPWSKLVLSLIALALIGRGLAFPLIKSRFEGNSDLFWYVSSGACVILGSLYAYGVYSLYFYQ